MDQNHANRWYGWIPPLYQLDTIKYFIQASDSSGRGERHPLSGWHSFEALPTELCNDWILGDLRTHIPVACQPMGLFLCMCCQSIF